MAITRADFKNIPSSGVIPPDRVPARAFAVAYAFSYEGQADFSNPNQSFTTRLVLHVLDGKLGGVKYVIRIEEKWNLFIIPLSPGLAIFTWNWVPTAEKIEGFKVTGPVGGGWSPPEIQNAPPMSTLGAATFGVEPAEDSGTTDGSVIVSSRFYSGIFTEPLDSGDSIKIKFHNASAGFVVARASLQLASEGGGATRRIDSVQDIFGGLLTARIRPAGRFIEAGRAWPDFRFRQPGGSVKGSEPSLLVLDDGTQVLGCMTVAGFVEFFSENDGWRWQRMLYPNAEAGFGTIEKVLWSDKATMPLLAKIGERRITIAILGGWLVARVIERDLGPVVRVGRIVEGESYSIDSQDDGRLLIVDSSGLPVWESQSGGLRWSEVSHAAAT